MKSRCWPSRRGLRGKLDGEGSQRSDPWLVYSSVYRCEHIMLSCAHTNLTNGDCMPLTATADAAALEREAEKGRVALKGFFGIAEEWRCTTDEKIALLGGVSRTTLYKYAKLPRVRLPRDTLERISLILGIYKALQVLYPTHERANLRVRLPTTDLPFAGKSAMEFMCQGSMRHLILTRQYFDAKRGWA